jgi:hypothetical protein
VVTAPNAPGDVVTVVWLVRLAPGERATGESAIVASFGRAGRWTEGDDIFLVVHDEETRGRLKVGDIVHRVAEPFGVVWLAECGARGAGVAPGQDWAFSRRSESGPPAAAKARP